MSHNTHNTPRIQPKVVSMPLTSMADAVEILRTVHACAQPEHCHRPYTTGKPAVHTSSSVAELTPIIMPRHLMVSTHCRVDPRLGFFLDSNQYTHPPLELQLDAFNVRAFEFDLYDDRAGGKFADKPIRAILGLDETTDTSAEMNSAGVVLLAVYTSILRLRELSTVALPLYSKPAQSCSFKS